MDQRGGWLSSDGPSPELEARWGPHASAPASSPAADGPGPSVADTEPVWQPVIAPEAPRARTSTRTLAAITGGLVVAFAAVVVGVAVLHDDEPAPTAVVSAASGAGTTDDSAQLSESAKAFLERWNAGPSTTMPLGEAGVPLHERPTTTTSTTTTVRMAPNRSSSASSPAPTTATERRTTYEPEKPSPPKLAADDPRLRGAEAKAQEFVDAMLARDCEALWATFSTRTLEFFAEMDAASEDGTSTKDEFCTSLREEELPTSIIVHTPAEPYRDGALVDLEAEGEVEELALLLEGERWTVDLFGAYYDDEE